MARYHAYLERALVERMPITVEADTAEEARKAIAAGRYCFNGLSQRRATSEQNIVALKKR
jgi:hypothetical protein